MIRTRLFYMLLFVCAFTALLLLGLALDRPAIGQNPVTLAGAVR